MIDLELTAATERLFIRPFQKSDLKIGCSSIKTDCPLSISTIMAKVI